MELEESEVSKIKEQWIREQHELRKNLVTSDVSDWQVCDGNQFNQLDFVGGVDISFVKEDNIHACAALVILSYPELQVVYEDYEFVHLTAPYIPEFLAFREVCFLKELLNKLEQDKPEFLPKVIFVDGNGILHPRGFGLASHLGVITDTCTIGVGKTLFQVDGLEKNCEHLEKIKSLEEAGDSFPLVGNSGSVLGAALRSTKTSRNPIYVSIGHKISLKTSLKLTQYCCKHRIPEPIRQADIRSREFLRVHYENMLTTCGCEQSQRLLSGEEKDLTSTGASGGGLWHWCSLL